MQRSPLKRTLQGGFIAAWHNRSVIISVFRAAGALPFSLREVSKISDF